MSRVSKPKKLSIGKSLVTSIPITGELRANPVEMASGETATATQIGRHQIGGKLLRAVEEALMKVLR